MEIPVREVSQPLPIDTQNGDSFYADERWLNLIQTVYGFTVTRLEVRGEDGALRGFLPVCALSSPLTGRRIVSLPFSDTCGMMATTRQPRINCSTRQSNWGTDTAPGILSFALAPRRFSRSVKISSPPITTFAGDCLWRQVKRVSGQVYRNPSSGRCGNRARWA